MEERQIQEFVYRVSHDEALRQELASHPEVVIEREKLSPGVAKIVARLIPHLTLMQPLDTGPGSFWH
ncbi:MAG TPA: hypothetical protein VKV37_17615 [Ktedonobacteraceae bacterium]|jgi:hypothetical protein|nr:hypothetical protein [Ktedonobacteraceae bacterium]